MTTVSTVDEYTGVVPNRSQSQTNFNTNVNDFLNYIDGFAPDLNITTGEINTVSGEINSAAAAAAQDANDAASAALAATATANATVYSGAATYDYPDVVIGSDGHTYRCLGTGVTGDDPVGSVTGDWLSLTIGSRHVTNEAALGTGEAEGQLAVTADDRIYTWDLGTTKWIARNGNRYTSSPSFANVTFPIGCIAEINGQLVRYNGTDWKQVSKNIAGDLRRAKISCTASDITFTPYDSSGYHIYNIGWCPLSSSIVKTTATRLVDAVYNYVYLDTSNFTYPREIVATDIYFSDTAPTYTASGEKIGWYNGDDRCIFMALAISINSFDQFYHDGSNYVHYDASKADLSAAAISNTWTDVTLSIPPICSDAMVSFLLAYVDANSNLLWRKNGSSGTGHAVCRALSGTAQYSQARVVTDSSQIIEVETNTASAQTASVFTNGFYLPNGM